MAKSKVPPTDKNGAHPALLARLTPEERSTLLERRLGPTAVARDNQALASQLAQPMSVCLALADLNLGQLRLLRWLGMRPNLEATWAELLEAVGDRLSLEPRDAYLLDLRLWGLADAHPTERGGFVATYPAVIAHWPTRRRVELRQRLHEMTSDLLARTAGALGLKNPPTRKDGRIALIMSTLSEPATCRAAVERASAGARSLFARIRERGGSVTFQEVNRRAPVRRSVYTSYYGSMERFWRPLTRDETLDPLTEVVRCALVLPESLYGGSWYGPTSSAIPEEVEMAYSGKTLLDTGPMKPRSWSRPIR